VALSLATGCLTLIRGHLHVLGDGRGQFCPLTVVETGRGRRLTRRQLGRFLKTMRAASDVAPASATVPTMVASTGGGGGGSFKRQLDSGGLDSAGNCTSLAVMAARVGAKFAQGRGYL
jgi:hypothetical protein